MKKLSFLLVSVLLMSCGAKNSNTTNAENTSNALSYDEQVIEEESAEVQMTEEEKVIATKVGALRATKLEDGNFEVKKLVSPEVYHDCVSYDKSVIVSDSMPLIGVVSQNGKWLIQPEFHAVHKIGNNAYVGEIETPIWDDETRSYPLKSLYIVIYDGKGIGNWGSSEDIQPVELGGKIRGFLKKFEYDDEYSEEHCVRYFYIDINGEGHDDWIGVENWSHPHFTNYRIEGNILTLWGDGFETPEELRKDKEIPKENKSIYQVDLKTGKVLYDPFVPED